MEPRLDPYTAAQIRDFGRELESSYQAHRHAIAFLARERLLQDLEAIHQPPKLRLRPWPLRVAGNLAAAVKSVLHHHSPDDQDITNVDDVPGATSTPIVIIVDPPAAYDHSRVYRPVWTTKSNNPKEEK